MLYIESMHTIMSHRDSTQLDDPATSLAAAAAATVVPKSRTTRKMSVYMVQLQQGGFIGETLNRRAVK